jgi:geranylgeranyl diphosphate synthase type I
MTNTAPPNAHATATGSALVDIDDLRSGVEDRLRDILHEQGDTFATLSADASSLIDAWKVLLLGGKRLRAAFCYWGYRVAHEGDIDQTTRNQLYRIGAALELFQAAALFHDDVMDRSDTRRGNPTAHVSFTEEHRTRGYLGDADQYGISAAILLGDLSLVAAENEFRTASYHFPEAGRLTAHGFFDRMRTVVSVGQFMDIHAQVLPWSDDLEAAKQRALAIIATKTSTYTVTYPLLTGAALAGASAETLTRLERFAQPIGVAYQLLDDLLGTFGDSATTGKPSGDDLREGKRTVLVIEALSRLDGAHRAQLQDALGNPNLTDAQIVELVELISSSGAVAAAQELVETLSSEGLAHLEGPGLNPVGVDMLRRITAYSLKRDL